MKAKGYRTVFVVVLINLYILGVVSDMDENSQPYYEYIQIYKSIPAIFEYLLNALEERPEILENNDVNMFKRNIDLETDESDSDNTKKIDKRDTESVDTKSVDDHGNDNYENKSDTSDPKDVTKTTVAYEYGNSNVVMKGLDELERKKAISRRFANNDNFINNAEGMKRELLKEKNSKSRKKRNVLLKLDDDTNYMFQDYGDVFFGFEHLFGLDVKPEDIEERILMAEKLLEDHNNKKNKK